MLDLTVIATTVAAIAPLHTHTRSPPIVNHSMFIPNATIYHYRYTESIIIRTLDKHYPMLGLAPKRI